MRPLTCVIIDDEPLAIEVLKNHLGKLPHLHLLASFDNPFLALHYLQTQPPPDLLFLDIQMPGLTGFDLAKLVGKDTALIFTTAYREYALQGFEHEALDYLVKPVSFDRFVKAISRCFQRENLSSFDKKLGDDALLYVKADKAMVRINVAEVLYVESLKNYVRIKMPDRELISYYSLTYLEEKLPKPLFQRVQKSFIVNLSHVESYTAEQVTVGKKEIPLGKLYKEELLRLLNQKAI